MPSYDFNIAKESLTEAEKDRILAIYLNSTNDNASINWEKAAADYGSASIDSMKVSLRNTFKKLDKAGARIEDDGSVVPAAATPVKTPKGGKRKAAEEGGEGGGPKKKGRAVKKKKAAAEIEEDGGDGDDDAGEKKVKEEVIKGEGEEE